MRPVVVSLDMLKVGRLFERRDIPIQFLHPPREQKRTQRLRGHPSEDNLHTPVNGWVSAANRAEVALEMANIHRIEANLSSISGNISNRGELGRTHNRDP
jgi:hypothetical protein